MTNYGQNKICNAKHHHRRRGRPMCLPSPKTGNDYRPAYLPRQPRREPAGGRTHRFAPTTDRSMVQNDDNKRIFACKKTLGWKPSTETGNDKSTAAVGADLCVCPPPKREMTTDLRVCLGDRAGNMQEGEHIGSPLQRIVQWFKTMTTNEYLRGIKTLGWKPSTETGNDKSTIAVGADLCVCPPPKREMTADQRICLGDRAGNLQEGEHIGSPLQRIVQWFKTMTTNEYLREKKHWVGNHPPKREMTNPPSP